MPLTAMSHTSATPTHRKHHPLHDYRKACIYHITLVCSDRAQVLAKIVGNTIEEARCELTPLGVAISHQIVGIEVHGAQRGRNLQIIAKAVMPDHIHFIIYVRERLTDCTLGDIIRGFKQGCNKALRAALAEQEDCAGDRAKGAPPSAGCEEMSPHEMGAPKNDEQRDDKRADDARSAKPDDSPEDDKRADDAESGPEGDRLGLSSGAEGVLRPIAQPTAPTAPQPTALTPPVSPSQPAIAPHSVPNGYRQPPLTIRSRRMLVEHALFEADFDETILRRRGQLRTMINYVHNNPKHRWLKQRHPDLLIPMRGILIAGRKYDAIGNLTLLGLARQQVWVRSRWDETTRRQYQNDCIVKARRFHVLVSPFISPHEAAVRDVALGEGHAIIVLTDNGFTDYTQCPGGLYDYCVRGQVLVLVPSELPHIANKPSITRAECVMLNSRASEIANEDRESDD